MVFPYQSIIANPLGYNIFSINRIVYLWQYFIPFPCLGFSMPSQCHSPVRILALSRHCFIFGMFFFLYKSLTNHCIDSPCKAFARDAFLFHFARYTCYHRGLGFEEYSTDVPSCLFSPFVSSYSVCKYCYNCRWDICCSISFYNFRCR